MKNTDFQTDEKKPDPDFSHNLFIISVSFLLLFQLNTHAVCPVPPIPVSEGFPISSHQLHPSLVLTAVQSVGIHLQLHSYLKNPFPVTSSDAFGEGYSTEDLSYPSTAQGWSQNEENTHRYKFITCC